MFKKWLCLLLALALCGASPGGALGETIYAERVDEEVLSAETAGDTGLTVEVEGVGLSSPEEELPGDGTGETPEPPDETGGEAVKIQLSAKKLSLGVKEKYAGLTATLSPAGATNKVTWSSSNKSVVAVKAKTGALTARKTGAATITAKTDNGLTARCKVTVKSAPKSVSLDRKSLTLSVGQSFTLTAKLPKGSASMLTYSSSKKKIAAVKDGVVTARKVGTAKITVKTYNGRTARCKVKVVRPPKQVLLPKTLSIYAGEKATVTATALDSKGKDSPTTFTYSAEPGTGSVRVDAATGEVTGVSAGTAYIRVTTHNGVTTHLSGGKAVETVCVVTVEEGPERVELAAASATIGLKQSLDLSPRFVAADGSELSGVRYTVKSSDEKKASASAKGVVKGLSKGSCTVTVTAANGVSAKCAVKVVTAATSVTLSPAKPVIGQGQTVVLKAKFPKGTMASVTFSSSAPNVASVDAEGRVTGLETGAAVITAKTHNGKKDKVTVTVNRGPDFIVLNADYELVYDELTSSYSVLYHKTLSKGKTFQITYENEYQTYGDVVAYESQDASVARVSDKGLVTAVSGGEAIIVVRSSSGAEAKLKVTVPGAPAPTIAFQAEEVSLEVGQTVAAPELTGTNIDADSLAAAKYTSSNKKVFKATWSEEENRWMLRGVKAGRATLKATAAGAKATVEVVVTRASEATEIAFESDSATMKVGEAFSPVVVDNNGNTVDAELYSSDTGVASVDEAGTVTATGVGSAVITAVHGALRATMSVRVNAALSQVTLDVSVLTLGVGQRHTLEVEVDGEPTSANLSFSSSNTAVATVSRQGKIIARGAGTAQITVTAAGGAKAICSLTVAPAPTAVSLEPASISARLDEGGTQLVWRFGASDEVGDVTFASANKRVAEVSAAGYVSYKSVGATTVSVRTNNGLTASIPVTVLPERPSGDTPVYRLFAAYSYFDSSYSGYLPFPRNNARSMTGVFSHSSVDGLSYRTKLMGNPSKTQLLSGIASFFSESGDNDVGIVYLCSHGQMNGQYTDYRLLLPGSTEHKNDANYYITSREIMNCLTRISGKVVLVLDSCYSGTFLEDMSSALDAQGGRIAVLTAASDTRASYYNVKNTNKAVDFYTYFLLQGLGYNEREGYWNADSSGGQGSYPGYLAADRTGNNDGKVTLGELYSYTSKCIAINIPVYMTKSWYWGDKTRVQAPRYYAGSLNSLVIYRPGE